MADKNDKDTPPLDDKTKDKDAPPGAALVAAKKRVRVLADVHHLPKGAVPGTRPVIIKKGAVIEEDALPKEDLMRLMRNKHAVFDSEPPQPVEISMQPAKTAD